MTEPSNQMTQEMADAFKEVMREEAAAAKTTWEAIAAGVFLLVFYFTRPPLVSNGTPFLIDFPIYKFIFDFIVLTFATGFGFSALRRDQTFGVLIGWLVFLICGSILIHWFYRLV